MPKYPDILVALSGEDGNAFSIMARTTRAMKRAGIPDIEIREYTKEATSGDYDHLLQTTMKYVSTK